MVIGTAERATELYISWINGNREYVMDEIAECDATMTMLAEISLVFLRNGGTDLEIFLKHIAKYA